MKGGGVYIESGSFTMESCTISGNTAGSETSDDYANANAFGGGIYGANGTIIDMNHTTISENKVASKNDAEGAGVYLYGAELTMQGNSEISDNSCVFEGHASSYGGGVYINNSSTFTMTSGEISKNSAEYGGGVYVYGGKFIMNGGSISNNTVTENGKGKGVHVVKFNDKVPLFNISGNASITEDNDVYLTADQKITITGNLSSETVARITPQSYAENSAEDPAKKVKVLDAVGGITLSEQRIKFNVTQSDKFKTELTDEGGLKNTLNDAEDLKVDPNLYDICSTINVSTSDGMKAISDLSQKKDGVDGKDYAGKTIILEDDVTLDNNYMLIKTFSGVFKGNNKKITLNKDIYDYVNYFGGAIFNVITGENAKVIDLNVDGEAYIAGIAIKLENCAVILNCNNSADITSPNNEGVPACGGIVGELSNEGFIKNCKNEGTITYNSTNDKGCGGIVGIISSWSSPEINSSDFRNSIIANCINTGEIKRVQVQIEDLDDQAASIGGICGEVTGKAAIYNCVNTQEGSVTSLTDTNVTDKIGGITGYCSVSFSEEDFTSLPADMGIFNCYNSGSISCTNNSGSKYVGGIVGQGRVDYSRWIYYTIRVTNTVNNDDETFSIGNIINSNDTVVFDITNNFYKKNAPSPIYPSGISTFYNNPNTFVTKLNEYSTKSNGKYLQWCVDPLESTNIIFSKEIIDNQEITP